ncbi:MAG: uroporphyrinogen-III synthase [Anaerolineae bacterium]|nr:uroporphyrinogen-III synthase [Anaerolineae bacterium]
MSSSVSPLAGKRILITRPRPQAESFAELLRAEGAIPILFPTIRIEAMMDTAELDARLRDLECYDWIVFTSANGVKVAFDRLAELKLSLPEAVKFAVIGPVTAQALAQRGISATVCPERDYTAEGLLAALGVGGTVETESPEVEKLRLQNSENPLKWVKSNSELLDSQRDFVRSARQFIAGNSKFLLLRAEGARATLRDGLVATGALVDEVVTYRATYGEVNEEAVTQLQAGVDILTFTSSSTVRHFVEMLGDKANAIAEGALIACIGPITAQSASELGLRVDVCASESTVLGLITAIKSALSTKV